LKLPLQDPHYGVLYGQYIQLIDLAVQTIQ
jgi:hypothetical protein